MATIDLAGYSLSELKKLQDDIKNQIKEREHQEVKRAREQILAIAQGVGMALDEILSGAKGQKIPKVKGEKREAIYRNPADASQTWSGRGRQPRWMVEGLASGKTLDDFRI